MPDNLTNTKTRMGNRRGLNPKGTGRRYIHTAKFSVSQDNRKRPLALNAPLG
jgi:hypothetical protein